MPHAAFLVRSGRSKIETELLSSTNHGKPMGSFGTLGLCGYTPVRSDTLLMDNRGTKKSLGWGVPTRVDGLYCPFAV